MRSDAQLTKDIVDFRFQFQNGFIIKVVILFVGQNEVINSGKLICSIYITSFKGFYDTGNGCRITTEYRVD